MGELVSLFAYEPPEGPVHQYQFYLEYTGQRAIEVAKLYLNINQTISYTATIVTPDGERRLLNPIINLGEQNIFNGCSIELKKSELQTRVLQQNALKLIYDEKIHEQILQQTNNIPKLEIIQPDLDLQIKKIIKKDEEKEIKKDEIIPEKQQEKEQEQENKIEPKSEISQLCFPELPIFKPEPIKNEIKQKETPNENEINIQKPIPDKLIPQKTLSDSSIEKPEKEIDISHFLTKKKADIVAPPIPDLNFLQNLIEEESDLNNNDNEIKIGDDEEKIESEFKLSINSDIPQFQPYLGYGTLSEIGANSVALETHYSFNTDCYKVNYTKTSSFNDVLTDAINAIGLNNTDEFAILIKQNGENKWFEEESFLDDYNPTIRTELYIFEKMQTINVYSTHFKPKKITVNITQKISEIVKIICKGFEMESYHCYSLCSLKDKNRPLFMDREKSIPEQTDYFEKVLFARQFHIYSMEDLSTARDAKAAFEEIKDHADECTLDMDAEMIIEYAALCMMSQKGFNPKEIPDDISEFCQGSFKRKGKGNGKGQSVKQYIKANGVLDRFSAMSSFIGFVRRIPGFDSHIFKCLITTEHKGKYNDFKGIIDISPYRILIVDPKTKEEEERVNLSEIISVKLVSSLVIYFRTKEGKGAIYSLQGEKVHEMYKLITDFIRITTEINIDRAKKFLKKGNYRKHRSKRDRLMLKTTNDINDKNPEEYEYDKNFNGTLMRSSAISYLELKPSKNYCLLVHKLDSVYKWLNEEDVMQSIGVQNGMTLYILEKEQNINFIFPDNKVRAVEVDVSKPINEVIKRVFTECGFPDIKGYTLWCDIDGKRIKPLDNRISIPEQCNSFNEFYLMRKFFDLSKDVFQTKEIAIQTLHECSNRIYNNKIQIPQEKVIDMTINYLIATRGSKVHEKKYKLKKILPPSVSITDKLQKEFDASLENIEDTDQLAAAQKYIEIVKSLDNFGIETLPFAFYYDDANYKSSHSVIENGTISFLSQGILINDSEGNKIYQMIKYSSIKSWETDSNEIAIKCYINNEEKITIMFLQLKKAHEADMILSYEISIHCKSQHNGKKVNSINDEEVMKRIKGEFVDSNGKKYGPMLDFHVAMWGENQSDETYWFELSTEQEEVIKNVLNILKCKGKSKYAAMINVISGVNRWLLPGMTLKDVKPYRNSVIYLHKENIKLNIIPPSNEPLEITVKVTDTVIDIVQMIGKVLHIPNPMGYTLLYEDNKIKHALDPYKTIVEQTNNFDTLYFKRFYYVLNNDDLSTQESINELYNDAKILVSSGKVDMKAEVAMDLAYFYIRTDKRLPGDIKKVIPPFIEIDANLNSKLTEKLMFKQSDNQIDTRIKYINIARSLPTFGSIISQVTYVEIRDNLMADIASTLFISPKKIIVKNNIIKKTVIEADSRNFIKAESIGKELMIKASSNSSTKTKFILIKSDEADKLCSIIKYHIDLIKQNFMRSIEDLNPNEDPNKSSERVWLFTVKGMENESNGEKISYDLRYTGEQVLKRAIKMLKIDPTIQYSLLLRITEDEFRWIKPDEILGLNYSVDGMLLRVFTTNIKIKVHVEGGPSLSVLVDITRPLYELIPVIAERFSINYYIGMTLYVEYPPHKPVPLDLYLTIPEQVSEPTNFIIKRRFIMMTQFDIDNNAICKDAYEDIKSNILSGNPILEGNLATEMAIYSIYADNTETDPEKVKIPNNSLELYPMYTPDHKMFMEKITEYIRNNKVISQNKAIRKYASLARMCPHFSCEIFNCTIEENNVSKEKQQIKLSVGPLGLNFFGKLRIIEESGEKKELNLDEKIMYKYICEYYLMINYLIIRIEQTTGHIKTITITSDKSESIFKIIRQYKEIITNQVQDSQEYQKSDENIKKLISKKVLPIKLGLCRYLDQTKMLNVSFGFNNDYNSIIKLACYYFGIPQDIEKYTILYYNENRRYKWVSKKESLPDLNPNKGAIIFILPENPIITIQTTQEKIDTFKLNISSSVRENAKICCEKFHFGNSLGFTFYSIDDEKMEHPFDIRKPFSLQTNYFNDLVLHRRFFVWTTEDLQDTITLQNIYIDIKNSILEGVTPTTYEQAIDFAVISLFADNDNNEPNMFSKVVGFNNSDFRRIFPRGIEITQLLVKKFHTVFSKMQGMDKSRAIKVYIKKAIQIDGYGQEIYNVSYRNTTLGIKSDNAVISLNPRRIQITDSSVILTTILYSHLSIFKKAHKGKTYYISYQNQEGKQIDIELGKTQFINEIDTYIKNIIEIYQTEEFDQEGEILNDVDQYQSSNMNNSNESVLSTSSENIEQNNNEDNTDMFVDYLNVRYRDKINQFSNNADETFVWRVNIEGLNLQRAERVVDGLKNQLSNISKSLEGYDPKILFSQFSLINSLLDQVINALRDEELIQSLIEIRAQTDAVFAISQDIIQNDQETHPYIDTIKEHLEQAVNELILLKDRVVSYIFDFKQAVKRNDNTQNRLINRELPEVSKGLLCVSEAQETLSFEILKKSEELSRSGVDLLELVLGIQSTSTTLTLLAGTVSDSQTIFNYTANILPQLELCKSQLEETKTILQVVEIKNFGVSSFKEAIDDLERYYNATQQTIQRNMEPDHKSNPSNYSVVLGYDKNIEKVTDDLSCIQVSVMKSKSIVGNSIKLANLAVLDSIKKLNHLNHNKNNDQARLEAIVSLQHTYNTNVDTISVLNESKMTNKIKKITDNYSVSLDMIQNQLDIISTKNITPGSISKINKDLQFILKRSKYLQSDTFMKLKGKRQAKLKELFMSLSKLQGNLQQQLIKFSDNVCNGEIIGKVQKILVNIKESIANISRSVEKLAEINDDPILPVLFERLSYNLKKTLNEPDFNGENVSRCKYLTVLNETTTILARLINEIMKSSLSPIIEENIEMRRRIELAIEKTQNAYIDLIDVRNKALQDPYSKEVIDMVKVTNEKSETFINEVQVLTKRIADEIENIEIEQMTDRILFNIEEIAQELKNTTADMQRSNVIVKPPSYQKAESILKSLKKLFNLTQYYVTIPEISESTSKFEVATKNLQILLQMIEEVSSMGNKPTEKIYTIKDEIVMRFNSMQVEAMKIPSFAESPKFRKVIPEALDLIKNIEPKYIDTELQTIQSVKASVITVRSKLSVFKNKVQSIFERIPDNKPLKKLLFMITATERTIDVHMEKQIYTLMHAILDKEALEILQTNVSFIPLNIRIELNNEEIDNLIESMSSIAQAISGTVSTIRSLQKATKVNFSLLSFPRIDISEEIDAAYPVIKKQYSIIKRIIAKIREMPEVQQSVNLQIIVNNMRRYAKELNVTALNKDDEPESAEILSKMKTILPDLIFNVELIEPIANSENLTIAVKKMSESISTLAKMISIPHLNAEKLVEFNKEIIPQLENIKRIIVKEENNKEILDNLELAQLLEDLKTNAEYCIDQLPYLQPRFAQQRCDFIYRTTCSVLPILYEMDLFELEEATKVIAVITKHYTALSTELTYKTDCIVAKKRSLTKTAIETVIKQACLYLEKNVVDQSNDVFSNIYENMNIIREHLDTMPEYLAIAVDTIIPLLDLHDPDIVAEASRIIAAAEPNWPSHTEYIKSIAISSAILASNTLQQIQTTIRYLQEMISINPEFFSKETRYYNANIKEVMKKTDLRMILEIKSLLSIILNIDPMHNVLIYVSLIIESLNDSKIAQSIINPLKEATKAYYRALQQLDLALYEIFMTQLDRIVVACDEANMENPRKITNEVKKFIHTIVPILKIPDRFISFGPMQIHNLAMIYKDFLLTVVPTIDTSKYSRISEIINSIRKIEEINGLLTKWIYPIDTTDKSELRDFIISSINIIEETIDSEYDQVAENLSTAIHIYSPAKAHIHYILLATEQLKKIEVDTIKLEVRVDEVVSLTEEAKNYAIVSNRKMFFKSIKKIKILLVSIRKLIKEMCPFDFSEEQEFDIGVQNINTDSYLLSISNQSCLSVARSATIMLDDLKAKVEKKNAEPKQPVDAKKDRKLLSVQHALDQSILSIELNPVIQVTAKNIDDIIPLAKKSLKGGSLSIASIPLFQHEFVMESNILFLFKQRIEALRQILLIEFPYIIKRLEKASKMYISEDQVTTAIVSINSLLKQLVSKEDLMESISRLSADQVIILQVIINFILESLDNNSITLPIEEDVQNIQARKSEFLEEVASSQNIYQLHANIKTNNDVIRSISRGFSVIKLIESLLTVQQQVFCNEPELCNFIHSPEGQQAFTMRIDQSQVLDIQQHILKSIDISDSPEYLKAFISTLTTEQLILEQRIINASLKMLLSEELYDIITDSTTETTQLGILNAANVVIQRHIREDSNFCKFPSLVNIEIITKAHEEVSSLLERMQTAQSLIALQSAHEVLNPSIHKFNQNIDLTKQVDIKNVKKCCKVIQHQIECLKNIKEFAKEISDESIEEVQNIQVPIVYLAGYIATTPNSKVFTKEKSSFSAIADKLSDYIQKNIENRSETIPRQLECVKHVPAVEMFTEHEKIIEACSSTVTLTEIVSTIRGAIPNIDELSKNGEIAQILSENINEAKMISIKNEMLFLVDIVNQHQYDLSEAVNRLTREDMIIIYALLTIQINKNKNLEQIQDVVYDMALQSRLFDYSLLIQADPYKGVSNHPASETLPNVDELSKKLSESYEKLAEAELSSNIMKITKKKSPKSQKELKIMQDFLLQQEKYCNNEKFLSIEEGIVKQLFMVGTNNKAFLQELKDETNDDSTLSLALIHFMTSRLSKEIYMMNAINGVNFTPENPYDIEGIDTKTQESVSLMTKKILKLMRKSFKNDPESLAKIHLPYLGTINRVSEISEETLARAKLRIKLIIIESEIINKDKKLCKAIQEARKKPNYKLNITPDEIKQFQSEAKYIIESNINSAYNIFDKYSSTKAKVKKIAIINTLINILEPQRSFVSFFTDNSAVKPLFKTSIDVTSISTVSSNVEMTKPNAQIMKAAASIQTATVIIPVLSHFSNLPLPECKRIFTTENRSAIKIIEDLMKPKTQEERDASIQELTDIIPQHIASLTRVLEKEKKEVSDILVKDPACILKMVEKIQMSSADLSCEENAEEFREMNVKMLRILKDLDAGLSEDNKKGVSKEDSISVCANLVNSIKTREINLINEDFIELHALETQNIANNVKDENLEYIIEQVKEIEKEVQDDYIVGEIANDKLIEKLNALQENTIKIINKETPNPFIINEGLSSQKEITEVFKKSSENIDTKTEDLIDAIKTRSPEKSQQLISCIIKDVADSQAAMFRKFELSSSTVTTKSYVEYMTMIGTSMNTVQSIIDINNTKAVSSIAVKRSTRSFKRMLDSMMASLNGNEEENQSPKKDSPIEKSRLEFIKSAANVMQIILSTVSANAGSKVPESFKNIIKHESKRIHKSIKSLKSSANNVLEYNVNEQLTVEFGSCMDELIKSLEEFEKIATSDSPTLDDLTKPLVSISSAMQRTLEKAQLLTDVVDNVPDFESAEKLIQVFTMPNIPNSTDIDIRSACKVFGKTSVEYLMEEVFFLQIANNPDSSNESLIDAVPPLLKKMEDLIVSIFTVSAKSLSLSYQEELNNNAKTLGRLFNSLLRSLKDKFLLKGDFDILVEKVHEEIDATISRSGEISNLAMSKAMNEESFNSTRIESYANVISPIMLIIAKEENNRSMISQLECCMLTYNTLNYSKACGNSAVALKNFLLYSKDQMAAVRNPIAMFEKTTALVEQLQETVDKTGDILDADEPELVIINNLNKLAEAGYALTSTVRTTEPKAKKFLDDVKNSINAVKNLATAAEEVTNKRRRMNRAKGQTKTDLLKRLELESKVAKTRFLLEHSEREMQSLN